MKTYPTTKKDFELFKKECRKWIDVFGMKGWQLYFYHEKIEDVYANCQVNLNAKMLTITLSSLWYKKPTTYYIKLYAFHETCEGLLGRMNILSNYRHTTDSEITEASHEVIRILEKVIFEEEEGVGPE